jgi:lysophospholipase L1-like esterase
MLASTLSSLRAESTVDLVGEQATPEVYLADIRVELQKEWPHNRTIVIVCHGHSVPTGYFKTPEVRPFDSYPHLLNVAIQQAYPTSVCEVIRTGIGGENAEQGARRFATDVLAKKPDVVTIDYALNDRSIGLERARKAWIEMITQAQAAKVKVILMTPTIDLRASLGDADDPLEQHAAQIRELAREYHVGLADSYAAFSKFAASGGELNSVMSQSNHPNRQGHELVVPELRKWFVAGDP